jgi:DNA-directed RNA polymerase subunit RPC12/RpoP
MAGKLYYSETNVYAAPVHAIDISQECVDETAKSEHEWNEIQCPCGHKMYVKYTGREWVEQPDLARVGEVGVWGDKWVGLTDGDIIDLLKDYEGRLWPDVLRATEAKLKEKNT